MRKDRKEENKGEMERKREGRKEMEGDIQGWRKQGKE